MVQAVKEISLGDGFGEVAVNVNGARVVIHADGSVDPIDRKGVFIGSREFRDDAGKSLGVYDLYAAPEDLKDAAGKRLRLTFNDAVKHVAGLRNWHGHDGGEFGNEEALFDAMRSGRYKGEWFLPPLRVLQDMEKKKDSGSLRGTFAKLSCDSVYALWYWSCTAAPNCFPSHVWVADFTDGRGSWERKDLTSYSSRVVRAEPRPSVI